MNLFDYSTSPAQEVPTRLLDGYRGYVMIDDYAGYNALGAQAELNAWDAGLMLGVSLLKYRKYYPKIRRGVRISR